MMCYIPNELQETQAWQVKTIKNSIKKANSKKAKFIDHQSVSDWLNSWGKNKEQLLLNKFVYEK
ncbi:MAG: hypothetical protein A3F17_00590 [Gammaproteobacteria bacterium RIFCSPHIGHO2_12_FULL_41_15]|nr:MAG: hypothetical protein A3F17_00590 [Gammaproteobacteria bacterium RIFCSPHIGHO2_12_FULL_41_15]